MKLLNCLLYMCIILTIITCQVLNRDQRPTIKIAQGSIVGIKVYQDSGKMLDAYLGIPYAAAPVGNLRFSPPQRHEGWNGTLYASDYGPSCPQLPIKEKINESENCLFLNIWTPETSRSYPLPVVIFLDGDDFATGNRLPISGQDLASEDIIVVNLNYRLNIFGFLCFETQDVRGNMGILDQYLGFVWVRENIRFFGGDPNRVTLYGHSAGAASIAIHMASSRTAGFFQKVILSSGSAISPWHMTGDAKSASLTIARSLDCLDNSFAKLINCLRSKKSVDILRAYENFVKVNNSTSHLLPVVDTFLSNNHQYLPRNPKEAFESGLSLQLPMLTGLSEPISCTDYAKWSNIANQGYKKLESFVEDQKIPEIISRYNFNTNTANIDQLIDIIKWRYIEASNENVQILLNELKQLNFETKTEAPHYLQLQYLLQTSYTEPIYAFHLQNPGFVINAINKLNSCLSVDMLLVFAPLLMNQIARRRFNERELRFSNHIKQMWKNFIIHGNPTPSNQGKQWRRYSTRENYVEYVGMELEEIKKEVVDRIRRTHFWNRLLPKMVAYSNDNSNNIFKELQNTYVSPESGYRHAMYTLLGLVIALLALLVVCTILIKKRTKERERQFQMVY